MRDSEILKDFFLDRFERDAVCEAVYDYEKKNRYTYGDLDRRCRRLTNFLLDKAGIKKGDRVGICADNRIEYIDLIYSIIRTGMIMTSYNGKLTVRELADMIQNETPKVLFYETPYSEKIRELKAVFPQILFVGLDGAEEGDFAGYEDVDRSPDAARETAEVKMDDIAMLIHTGGSTGTPKAAMLPYATFFYSVSNHMSSYGFCHEDSAYLCMPMFHLSALISILFPHLYAGGHLVLGRKFCIHTFYEILNSEHLTQLIGVPGIFRAIKDAPEFDAADFSAIKRCICGAAPVTMDVMKPFWKKGMCMCNCYGITEGSPGVLSMPLNSTSFEKLCEKRLSVGKAMIYVKLRIVDEDGADVPQGTKGELLIHSAAMFAGYWNNPKETAKAVENGWLHTGDIAMQDDEGYYYLVGRKKNMFISHGENIFPAEIENVLQDCPGIHEVCVIGVPDPVRGETGMAIVVREEGSAITQEEVKTFAKANLATIKQPREIVFIDRLPRTGVGKIDTKELRRQFRKE